MEKWGGWGLSTVPCPEGYQTSVVPLPCLLLAGALRPSALQCHSPPVSMAGRTGAPEPGQRGDQPGGAAARCECLSPHPGLRPSWVGGGGGIVETHCALTLLQEARTTYRRILQESARKLNTQGSHLGSCIEKARPYYEARRLAKEVRRHTVYVRQGVSMSASGRGAAQGSRDEVRPRLVVTLDLPCCWGQLTAPPPSPPAGPGFCWKSLLRGESDAVSCTFIFLISLSSLHLVLVSSFA